MQAKSGELQVGLFGPSGNDGIEIEVDGAESFRIDWRDMLFAQSGPGVVLYAKKFVSAQRGSFVSNCVVFRRQKYIGDP